MEIAWAKTSCGWEGGRLMPSAVIKKIAARQSDYTKKWMNKLGKTKTNVLDVDKAITLLKSLGYKIFKEI